MAKVRWVDRFIDLVLKEQGKVIPLIPIEKRWQGRGRKGRLVIYGPKEPTVKCFRWTGDRLVVEPDSPEVRNVVELHEDTLIDLALAEYGPREAIAAGLIKIAGDRSLYDSEEMMNIIEKFVQDQVIPIFQRIRREG